MHLGTSLIALLASRASALALPQIDSVDVQDPVADLIAAYEEAIDVPVEEVVTPSIAEAKAGHNVDSSDAIAAAVADAVSGGLERRVAGNPMTVEGFTGPDDFGVKTINAPSGDTTYMGVQTFPQDTSYDPNICAMACKAKSDYNVRHAQAGVQPRICRFFVSYTVLKDGADPLFTCTYYTQPWDKSYAVNAGSTRSGVKYTNRDSAGYTLNEAPSACVAKVTDGNSYQAQGLAFRVYDQPKYSMGDENSPYSASDVIVGPSERTGVTQRLDWISANWPNGGNGVVTIGDYNFESGQKSVLAQGFFIAPTSGAYTFSMSPIKNDNWGRLWVGDKSYSTWNESNADAKVAFDYDRINQSPAPLVSSPSFTMTRGQIYPFTYLWSNGGGQAQSFLKITDAKGNDVSIGNFARPCNVETVFPLPGTATRSVQAN